MPEQMMCPMRSDAKFIRYCEPQKCMWGRYQPLLNSRHWICSAVTHEGVGEIGIDETVTKKGER